MVENIQLYILNIHLLINFIQVVQVHYLFASVLGHPISYNTVHQLRSGDYTETIFIS